MRDELEELGWSSVPKEDDEELRSLTHDLFTLPEFKDWLAHIGHYEQDRWYSVVVELAKFGAPMERLEQLKKEFRRGYVFRCIENPRSKGDALIIFFCLADFQWQCVVRHRPDMSKAR